MRIPPGIRTVCPLLLVALSVASCLAAAKPQPVAPATIRVPAAPVDPARRDLVEALRAAKAAGDAASARPLAARLGFAGDSGATAPSALPPSLAGALRIEHHAPPAAPTKWGGDVMVNLPAWQSDSPALVGAGDGTLYAAALTLDRHYINIYRSSDGGLSWWNPTSLTHPGQLSEPCLAIAEGNYNRLVLGFVIDSGGANSSVCVWTLDLDSGAGTIPCALYYPYQAIAHPRLCVDSPEYGYWYAYLACMVNGIDVASLVFTRTLDYGDSWQPPVTLASGMTLQDWPDIDFGGTTLALAYTVNDGDSSLRLRLSRDFGAAWEPPIVMTGPGYDEIEPRLAATTSGGTMVVTFARRYAPDNCDIECFWSRDHGSLWNYAYLPWSAADERRPSVIASRATGRLHATYWRQGDIEYTWADTAQAGSWSPGLTVNGIAATDDAWPVIAARTALRADDSDLKRDGDPDSEAGIAWAGAPNGTAGVWFDAAPLHVSEPVQYLVICPDSLAAEAGRLAGYRRARGLPAGVVRLGDIESGSPTAAGIDAWLESYWATNPSLRFVALAGGIALLPSFPLVNPASGESFYSDLRYACRDADFPDNYLPQLVVGRIPAGSRAAFATAVDKIHRFEESYGPRNRVVFFGHLPEMSYVATRDSALAVSLGYSVVTLYSPSEAGLMAALSTPQTAMVFYYGHGAGAENWPLHLGNLDLLTNADFPWLYFSGGCSFNDDYAFASPIGHALLLHGCGSATSAGAAVAGGYGYGYAYAEALLDQSRVQTTAGEVVAAALYQHHAVAAAAGQDVDYGSFTYWFTERMRLIGDPALRIDGSLTAAPAPRATAPLLAQNRPNPFNAVTTIEFELPAYGRARLNIYSAAGRRVACLLDGNLTAGRHRLAWDGRDARGRACASGIYFCRLEAHGRTETRRMTLVK